MSNTPVDPGAGSVSITGPAPVVDQFTARPGAGVLTLVGSPPDVALSDNRLVDPDSGTLVFSGPKPVVIQTSGARSVLLGSGALLLQGPPPIVQRSVNGIVPGTPQSYSSLITFEHRDKPLFKAVVELLVQGSCDQQAVLGSMPVLYQFDNAVGQQLDRVGAWIGLSRSVLVPSLGTVLLSDNDYRLLLISKIASNHFDGSFQQYQQILSSLFVGYGFSLKTIDNQNMSIDIYVIGATPTPLQLALMQSGYLPPKPEGVRINGITVLGSDPVFGTDHDDEFINGPDVGAFYP